MASSNPSLSRHGASSAAGVQLRRADLNEISALVAHPLYSVAGHMVQLLLTVPRGAAWRWNSTYLSPAPQSYRQVPGVHVLMSCLAVAAQITKLSRMPAAWGHFGHNHNLDCTCKNRFLSDSWSCTFDDQDPQNHHDDVVSQLTQQAAKRLLA